jgi:hypothetical protein
MPPFSISSQNAAPWFAVPLLPQVRPVRFGDEGVRVLLEVIPVSTVNSSPIAVLYVISTDPLKFRVLAKYQVAADAVHV